MSGLPKYVHHLQKSLETKRDVTSAHLEKALQGNIIRPLTKRNLRALETMEEEAGWRQSARDDQESTAYTAPATTISSTHRDFPDACYENGILPPFYSEEPLNLKELRAAYNQDRGSPAPSESQYKEWKGQLRRVGNEDRTVGLFADTFLQKYTSNTNYGHSQNKAWTDYPKNVGFNNGLSVPQPDWVEGLIAKANEPFPIKRGLGGVAVVTGHLKSITLPHLAAEVKAPGQNLIVAQYQAAYDGALMV